MSMKRNVLVIGFVVLVAVVLAGLYLIFQSHPLVADRAPGRIETAIARRLVVLSIPASARRQSNPNPPESDAWRAGVDQFQEDCAFCHGTDGRGHSEIASRMYPPVPDLADTAIRNMSDGSLFAIIRNGVRWTGMPAFRGDLSPDETWKLVSLVRQVPRLTPHDLHQPRSTEAAATPANTEGATILMDGTSFSPAEAAVELGETVTWVNKDPFPHTVSSSAGHFHSPEIGPDQQWRFTPAIEGRFPYICTLHPGMNGTLIVHNKSNQE